MDIVREKKMKKAIMYGAGNIGRGFIGALLSQSGFEVYFVDIADKVIDAINSANSYPVRYVSTEGFRDVEITNVHGINGNNTEEVASAIGESDIVATAVGANILKFIAPNLAAGIRKRIQNGGQPLNIIICENLMDANILLKNLIFALLSDEEKAWAEENVGFVEASIGRMVPVQTEEMQEGNPLRVCVESYGYLPVDKAAFKGTIPEVTNMIPTEPFDFFIKRKLYLHNMGHAVCAYLGDYKGYEYIWQAISDPEIKVCVMNAMLDSALSLSKEYGKDLKELIPHIEDLLYRFSNSALKDTCKRVGNDQKRKLAPSDRLIGSSLLAEKNGVEPVFIAVGIAGAVLRYCKENGLKPNRENFASVMKEFSRLDKKSSIFSYAEKFFVMMTAGKQLHEIRSEAEKLRAGKMSGIV